MKKLKNCFNFFYGVIVLIALNSSVHARSPFRPKDSFVPVITTEWVPRDKDEKIYFLRDSHLELNPLFYSFDKEHFEKNRLPKGPITFRNKPEKSVDGKTLNALIEELYAEVQAGKKTFKNFKTLKKRDFTWRKQAGLLVVECTKYPFVVKLFMETPRSFLRPHNKGFEPHCFFIIGGGSTRHLVGFTRIKNAQSIKDRLVHSSYWNERVDVPRKWFWTPKNARWIRLDGYNIGGHTHITTEMPGIYAIIADKIDGEREFHLRSPEDRRTAIDLSNFFLCRIDPHINNFIVEKETGKIVIIDTEHFPTLVGFKKRPRMTSYTSWYLHLLTKYLKDRFGRTKKERRDLQRFPQPPFSAP